MISLVNLRLPYNNKLSLACEACAFSWPSYSWAPNVPFPLVCQISLDFVVPTPFCFITCYHRQTSTPSPMQIMNHPLVPLPIVTNLTPPVSSPYWPLAHSCECGALTLHLPKPPWSCITKTFSPFHSIGPYSCPWLDFPTFPHFFNAFDTST